MQGDISTTGCIHFPVEITCTHFPVEMIFHKVCSSAIWLRDLWRSDRSQPPPASIATSSNLDRWSSPSQSTLELLERLDMPILLRKH